MTKRPERFRKLLSKAVREIAYAENKTMQIVQDELGFALGRANGSCIDYWRRGYIPAELADVEKLAQLIAARQGLPADELESFILSAEPLFSQKRITQLLSGANGNSPNAATFTQPADERELSPFIVGPPITRPRQFYGRSSELQRIFGWWRRRPLQNVAVVGPMRSGKTSLLHYIYQISQTPADELRPNQKCDWLPHPEQFRWILVDFQDPRMTQLERLLRYLLVNLGFSPPSPCTLDNFMDTVANRIHQPTVILIDELIAGLTAIELGVPFWWSLRSLVSHYAQGNLAFVLTAHDLPMHLAEVEGKPSPFFNMFNTIELGPLTESVARELIAAAPEPFPPPDVAWILRQSHCWPSLLQILCQVRFDAMQGHLPQNSRWQEEGLRQISRFGYLLDKLPSG